MQRTEINEYSCILTDIYVQISHVAGDERANLRYPTNYDDDTDRLTISLINPTLLHVESKRYRLLLHYDTEDEELNTSNNGRMELYYREAPEDEFISWVYYKTGIAQATIEHLMHFIQYPEEFGIGAPSQNNGNNNNNNNSNNPAGGGSRRKHTRSRKQKKRN